MPRCVTACVQRIHTTGSVQVGYVTSAVGTLLPLVNWDTPHNQSSFHARENYTRVTVSLATMIPPPAKWVTATLASCGSLVAAACAVKQGGVVRLNASADGLSFSVDVAIADAIILR